MLPPKNTLELELESVWETDEYKYLPLYNFITAVNFTLSYAEVHPEDNDVLYTVTTFSLIVLKYR